MPKLVCVKCQCELKPETNGTTVVEMAGTKPYKLWDADTWKCPGCGMEVITGFGNKPVMESFEPGFNERAAEYIVQSRRVEYDYERPHDVIDCS